MSYDGLNSSGTFSLDFFPHPGRYLDFLKVNIVLWAEWRDEPEKLSNTNTSEESHNT